MKTATIVRAAALALALPLASCVAGLPEGAEPPAPLPEFQSPAPAPGMVWVRGEWHWNGTDYVWVPGHWVSPPPAP